MVLPFMLALQRFSLPAWLSLRGKPVSGYRQQRCGHPHHQPPQLCSLLLSPPQLCCFLPCPALQYTLYPEVLLPTMVAEVSQALTWTLDHIGGVGGDAKKVGHRSQCDVCVCEHQCPCGGLSWELA